MIRNSLINFSEIAGYSDLISQLQEGEHQIPLSLPRSVRLPFLADLQYNLSAPLLFITSRPDRLQTMHEEFSFWTDASEHLIFAEPSSLFYEKSVWSLETRRDRLLTLESLARYFLPHLSSVRSQPVIFTSAKSIMTRTAPRRCFLNAFHSVQDGSEQDMEKLVHQWVNQGYSYAEIVVMPGQFSRRGGLLDIWPITDDQPVRIEFFGDEIETIRTFDPATQRSIERKDQVDVTPASEVITEGIDDTEENGSSSISEFNIPLIYHSYATLLDYLPKDTVVLSDNAASIQVMADEIESQAVKMRAENIKAGLLDNNFPVPYVTWSEIKDNLYRFSSIDLGFPIEQEGHNLSHSFSPGLRFGGRTGDFFDFIERNAGNSNRIFIVSKQIDRLKELRVGRDSEVWDTENVTLIEGCLSGGWQVDYKDGSVRFLFSDSEIFGWERPLPRRRRTKRFDAPEFSYADLNNGDVVVHIDYGIGRFAGLVRRSLEGIERDYLKIKYEGDDQLFIPIHQADRLSLYIGSDKRIPKLSSFGSTEWAGTKQRVRGAVREVAQEFLELYARRQTAKGYVYHPDTEWQKILESSFPYIETTDQAIAISEVKADMESPQPMDRLLCGDVGYGKTEVALRAAFKAVMDGRQVAMLVPTTVLAQQHFETFSSRLLPFPVYVEMLSRFRSPTEQAEILLGLETGDVDIVIGTHRLLQLDVLFKDLGLLIIDEEQKFGVTHKEFFKKMRTEIDVLTLTATPIPRTLYLTLSGIRDISVINSSPSDRLPIHTYVGGYDIDIVRRAVVREIDRGGQVFFVHNRVQTISAMAAHLQKIVPEARIGIAHGQMKEKMLAEVMKRFTAGDIDVLLSTSIIESGLDIPNANTLIVDRGDTFGLAQLYQLRGRVGRGSSRAYAYLFHHRKKLPSPEGLGRLETIAEHSHLGAGYSIAMRDLEMRGAGDLLGTNQHGHIADVGFYLYTVLLGQAVAEIQHIENRKVAIRKTISQSEIRPLVTVDLPLTIGIPTEYIPDDQLRLQIYRRIADITEQETLDELEAEFTDRFGPMSAELKNLLWQLGIKLIAEECGLASIASEGNHIVLRFPLLHDDVKKRELPDLGSSVRRGKNAYWLELGGTINWKIRLHNALLKLKEKMRLMDNY